MHRLSRTNFIRSNWLPGLCMLSCITVWTSGGAGLSAAERASQPAAESASPAIDVPEVLDPHWQIELVASEPELVTPVACCFDEQGRLLVIECHTHFPPDDYPGPDQDRIYLFDDPDGDGRLDRQRLFYAGGRATMGITPLADGWIAVSTRSQVIRIRDSDGDDRADQREVLLTLDTKTDYPHNGLAGMVVGPDGLLYVSQGENFGGDYRLTAADGSQQVGSGEGGNVYRMTQSGGRLERIATGFWNPFGLAFDPAGRLWTVDNDPDSRPPCRLLHVTPTGDYGFQFRFGRAGTNPLLSWDGEYPGTLPMAAGTGEAPGCLVAHGPHLWVTGWGDNRLERYRLQSSGATCVSQLETVVQGGAAFRPVDIATAPDGSLYVTDWADRSYPVHGKGRLWRLSRRADAPPLAGNLPPLSNAEQRAAELREPRGVNTKDRLAALDSADPFLRQAAIAGLVAGDALQDVAPEDELTGWQRLGLLTAWRWIDLVSLDRLTADQRRRWIHAAFADADQRVVMAALRWVTERGDTTALPQIESLLNRPGLSPELFSTLLAAMAYLEAGRADGGKHGKHIQDRLARVLTDPERSIELRTLALGRLSPTFRRINPDRLRQWMRASDHRPFRAEAVQWLATRSDEAATSALRSIAEDAQLDAQTRADAVAAVAARALESEAMKPWLETLAARVGGPDQEALAGEIRRVLRAPESADIDTPEIEPLSRWEGLVAHGGDPAAGRRVFLRAGCVNCHAYKGRGADTGPDLSTLDDNTSRLLESILLPSKEVGPLYMPWQVLTRDGRVLVGLKVNGGGVGTNLKFQQADGKTFEVPLAEIESQRAITKSIMPDGWHERLSVAELRDLIALLGGDG